MTDDGGDAGHGGGWPYRGPERRHEERQLRHDFEVAQRLEAIGRDVRQVTDICRQLRTDVDRDTGEGRERAWAIKRIEEKLGAVETSLEKIKDSYVSRKEHEDAYAPVKRVVWIVISTVVVGVLALLFKGGGLPH